MTRSIIVLCIVFILASIAFMFVDEDPTAEAKALLEKADQKEQSQAYFFLMGFMAAPEDDPITVGREIYNSIKAGEDRYINNKQIFSYTGYPDNKKLPLPQGDIFCSIKEQDCYSKIFSGAIDYQGDEHSLLRERYLTFLRMDDYQTLNQPLADAPFPPYAYLAKGLRSFVLENIQAANKGHKQQAITNLLGHIEKLRGALEKADNMVAKMFFSIQISETIDIISILCGNNDCVKTTAVPALNDNETSMESTLKNEFRMGYYLFNNLDKNKNFFSMENETPQILTPLIRLLFKPNMTINRHASIYTKWIALAKLKPADFAATLKNSKNAQQPWSARNTVGSILTAAEGVDYNVYIARMHDLNIKIALLNATTDHSDAANINIFNPYYREFQKPDINNGIACMKGPLEDTRNIRCLYLSLPNNSTQ